MERMKTWNEDIRMFILAGIDVATLNVFAWALNQPDEDTFNFKELDATIDRLFDNGIYTCLGASAAVHPAWMAKKYPDVLRVDFQGRKRKFGGRHNSSPNSPTYRTRIKNNKTYLFVINHNDETSQF